MYELARKHCGKQDKWLISLEMLKKKCGSSSSDKEFKRMVSTICEEDAAHQHMPDYGVSLDGENICFTSRGTAKAVDALAIEYFPLLDPETYQDAKIVAPGYDVYVLEQEWRMFWVDSGKPELGNPDAAFIGFCKRRYARNGAI